MEELSTNVLFFLRENGHLRAHFQARTLCRPHSRLGVQPGCAEIYVDGSCYGGRIFWGGMIAASGDGCVNRNEYAPLLLALKWTMRVYARAFDTCWECRGER